MINYLLGKQFLSNEVCWIFSDMLTSSLRTLKAYIDSLFGMENVQINHSKANIIRCISVLTKIYCSQSPKFVF